MPSRRAVRARLGQRFEEKRKNYPVSCEPVCVFVSLVRVVINSTQLKSRVFLQISRSTRT